MEKNEKIDNSTRTKKCQRCGKIFVYSGFGHLYCNFCKEHDERDFQKVKNYVYEHPGASAIEVSEITGVEMRHIETYLREGRLEIPENSPIFIKCELCKKDIRYGRLCPECAEGLTKAMKEKMNFDDYQIGEKPKSHGKMRFFGSKKD